MKKCILLCNLGSPDSFEVQDVKAYLDEFLMDERVIDVPKWLRSFIVKRLITPKRAPKSAEAYRSVWTPQGSPLIAISKQFRNQLQSRVLTPIYLAMRYGNPSIADTLKQMTYAHPDLESIYCIPLYPHFAMSSYETVEEKVKECVASISSKIKLTFHPPFYNDPGYIGALVTQMKPYLSRPFDHVLFSYHGLPVRHLKKSDPTRSHCYKHPHCCTTDNKAHATCYKHQVLATSSSLASQLGLSSTQYSVSFQSRLGRDEWIAPFTPTHLKSLIEQGVRRLIVACPSFVADCLETIEEIGQEARHEFLELGGESFELVPCLNTHPAWIQTVSNWVSQ